MSTVALNVVMNTDDAFLIWRADKIEACLGFAIERQWLKREEALFAAAPSEYLLNRVGFLAEPSMAEYPHEPSTVWPFQRYNWTDHEVAPGDEVQYRVVPMTGSPGALLADEDQASPWVRAVAAQPADGKRCFYFNRPMAASNWMARVARERGIKNGDALVAAMGDVGEAGLRGFCGGTLITALRALLAHAQGDESVALYAALFELRDAEVIDGFAKLGARAHLVLANGAVDADDLDPNHAAREQLRTAACQVSDRMTAAPKKGQFAHNKFIVVAEHGVPRRVWTGSTNLTTTGLFTQINNAVLIDEPELAAQYFTQWQRLAAAGSDLPATLRDGNAAPGTGVTGPVRIEPWFTPTSGHADLERLKALVDGAGQGILFLSFMPGPSGPLFDILEARAKGLYVRGVTNQIVKDKAGKVDAMLVNGSKNDPFELQVATPTGIKEQFAYWSKEFMRNRSLSVLVHSKVLCIDPFGERPIVVTGSHNFSDAASTGNDENFLVVEGDATLARAYAAHIMSVYNHYRWRDYVIKAKAKGLNVWQKLEATAAWQDGRLHSVTQQAEWAFWMPGATGAAPTP